MLQRQYIAIDLKSFYASVECVERGLNPLDTNLVVADVSRTEKTICLAVSPALKSFGVGGRPRLFEVNQRVRAVNKQRGGGKEKSVSLSELNAHPTMTVDYITATPRMALYIDYSTRIYKIYLRYIAPEDIHVYSIDEVFIDVTAYQRSYKMSAHELAKKLIREVLRETGITATAGIGTNMYLSKVAMDIVAKHMPANNDGVRIAELDEMLYRHLLWDHRPLTDFWRVGCGIAKRLELYGIMTMGDVARYSVEHEEIFYRLFGVNAELLIDHAWGWEPVTMEQVRRYKPAAHSVGSGQVLTCAYTADQAKVVVLEMADSLALDIFDKALVTDSIVLNVSYDAASLKGGIGYDGPVKTDYYGRRVPVSAHGSIRLTHPTSSSCEISRSVAQLFDRIVNAELLVRRINICANNVRHEAEVEAEMRGKVKQLELFTDYEALAREQAVEKSVHEKERRRQTAILNIRRRYGKNAILRGLNYADGATQRTRNKQIGGHKA